MLSSNGHLFFCLNGILSWNVSNLSFLMSSVFLSPIKNVKQLNGNTLIEPIINSFFLCDMVKLKLFLEIWNWLRWTFSVGDLPRLASQVSCVLAVQFGSSPSSKISRDFETISGFYSLIYDRVIEFWFNSNSCHENKTKFGNEGKEKGSALKKLILNEHPVDSYKKRPTLEVHLTAKDNLAARPKLK